MPNKFFTFRHSCRTLLSTVSRRIVTSVIWTICWKLIYIWFTDCNYTSGNNGNKERISECTATTSTKYAIYMSSYEWSGVTLLHLTLSSHSRNYSFIVDHSVHYEDIANISKCTNHFFFFFFSSLTKESDTGVGFTLLQMLIF